MAKKQYYWYVLVITNDGAKFVTKTNYGNKTAEWNMLEKPLEMTQNAAKDLSFGLMVNFFQAYAVCSPIELSYQPYRYESGHFEWVENEKEK